ncbi:MAG: SOS response-associated peptidase, partial [Alphaproteobacteria bacterium]|nr:SOS response-associated peptidase [Alphaproteobacteria bacterium]
MCGRYALTQPPEELHRLFAAEGAVPDWQPRYNIAPQTAILAVRVREGRRELASLRWGLVPHWAKDAAIGAKLANARGETVAEKPAFRDAFQRSRCIVPASAYYEWQKSGNGKQPYAVRLKDADCFGLAGLWSRWTAPDGSVLDTVALLTTEPNLLLAGIHDRMPVILAPDDYA